MLPADVLAQIGVRAAPQAHKQAMQPVTLQQAELCGACHNLRTPDGQLALEPTYDEWRASPYAARVTTCQSCHMPARAGHVIDSGLETQVLAHGGIPGAPSSLPRLANNAALLRQAATLTASVLALPDGALRSSVVVTNSGAGHYLPTGSDDLRQVWLEATLLNMDEAVIWQSGQLDAYGGLSADAMRFGKVLGDAQGRPIPLHRFWVATQILSDTRLAPLEARQITYDIPAMVLHKAAQSQLTLRVRLLYRDVSQGFAEFALDRPIKDFPVHEMARTEISVQR